MGHIHSIYDTDPHFKIDPVTRVITNMSETKTCIVQGDHNSERFTFECPRFIDGHDMSTCNQVQVHYINMDQAPREEHYGLYEVEDLDLSPEDENVVIFSWLISENATRYVGPLSFVVNFVCKTGTTIDYAWNTAIHADINVVTGINSGEPIIVEYADIMEAWKRELAAQQIVSMTQTKVGELDGGENVWTATFGNGMTANFVVRNGHAGQTNPAGTNYGSVKSGGDVTIENGIISVNWPGDDSGIAYSKTVPRGTSGVAEIKMLGGMTYKDGNTLRSAPVTAVESVGDNLLGCEDKTVTHKGITFSIKNCVVTANGTSSETYAEAVLADILGRVGTFYIRDYVDTGLTIRVQIYDANGNRTVYRNRSFTLDGTETRAVVVCNVDAANVTLQNATAKAMLNRGTTALPYTPFFKSALEIPEAVRAIDGYGWGVSEDIYNYIDYDKKQFVKRVGVVDMGALTWRKDTDYGNYYYATLADKKANVSMNLLCSKYTTTLLYGNEAPDKTIRGHGAISNNLLVRDEDYTDAATFKAAMSGVMLYYELATPVITDISDIMGDNHVEVEVGGTLTFVNEHGYDVPSVVDYSASADVRVIPQSLTASQKKQARANIGIHVVDSVPSDLSAYAIGDIILVTE
jgi:hypothetical protein